MALYTKNGSYPTRIPSRIKLSDGRTRTDPSTYTPEEIADAGYIVVEDPPLAPYPNRVDWDGSNWIIRPPNEEETAQRWNQIKQECQQILSDTDYKVIKALELNLPIDPNYVQYRQSLRDLYNNVNNVDPWFIEMPTLQNTQTPGN